VKNLSTIETIQIVGIVILAIINIGSIFIAFGKLSERNENTSKIGAERHIANVEALKMLTIRFEDHTTREDEWQKDQADRLTRVETKVDGIEEHLRNGYKDR
jgi:NAD/NADP transhydrogenase beta subunit